jgi:gamma-glutamyltranspeptidase / glutathione hydrolase
MKKLALLTALETASVGLAVVIRSYLQKSARETGRENVQLLLRVEAAQRLQGCDCLRRSGLAPYSIRDTFGMHRAMKRFFLLFLCVCMTTADAAWREPVRAPRGMVASTERIASQIGVDVMKRGGNAVDAAVAVAFALAVVYPVAGNLGGGGFMMILRSDGTATAIDYRETAPAAATGDMYIGPDGELIKGEGSSLLGYRASGVPGTVAGMAFALKKYGSGKLTWSELIEPARRLAVNGFVVTHRTEKGLEKYQTILSPFADSRRVFLREGKLYREGEILRQPELAATLGRLQKKGPREFYEGKTAQLIAEDVQRNGGLITRQDLRDYVPKERVPLRGSYRGYGIISMPPPSSGGAVLIEMLNILEGFDLTKLHPFSSEYYHLLVEAMRRAYADRAEYMGDPDFSSIPIDGLIEKAYAERQRSTINPERASLSSEIGAGKPTGYEPEQTTHFTIVDAAGNAVSNTYTLNRWFGSGVVAKGTGVLLNNEMDDFTSEPGEPNSRGASQSERNAIAPRKRPRSSMTPTFVLRPDGSLYFAIGTPGGSRIINTVLQIISNVIDHGMNMQEAIDSPRIHHQWLPDEIVDEPLGLSADTRRALEARGHKVATRPNYPGWRMSDAQGIMIEDKTGMRLGASDAREDGAAVGY